ncbi:hypothetical protein GCM10022220_14830 [Actinocatenispora rupis]|uniref:DUF3472 domain-containing protein n=2 Tax=Actinocatenispora rupis TaxID=519421 RepID=A0A8J3N8R2_9ACTN|nr:hypothetical protein Aru02nite_14680 [Actinocatenispora rupis]
MDSTWNLGVDGIESVYQTGCAQDMGGATAPRYRAEPTPTVVEDEGVSAMSGTRAAPRIAAIVLAVLAAVVATSPPAAAAAADPHYNWHSGAADLWNVDQTVRITATATDRFYAHQIAQSGTGAALYIGLQDNQNAPQHRLVFSVWNATGATGPGASSCHMFGNEGVG